MVPGHAAGAWFDSWRAPGSVFDPHCQNNLDLLRFVAATLVLVDHSFALTRRPGLPAPFSYETVGGFAVAIFFIISGFLVSASWQRGPRLVAFARKRALRIVPAYAAVVTISALVLGPALTDLPLADYFRKAQTWAYFRNLTFFQVHYALPGVFATNPYPHAVNGSIWTLPIEVAMYIALAALGRAGLLTRSVVSILVAVLAVGWFVWGPELWAAGPLYAAALPTGYTVQLALWFFTGSAFWFWRDRIRYRADIAAVLVALCWALQGTTAGGIALHVALPYLVLWVARLDVGWMSRFGRHGDFSYGMYLWAFPVQQTLTHFGGATWPLPAFMLACFAATLACAVASWHAVEHPALRRK
jgi:peptidoglycan/LPS O-acetylase OafA/YrhL